MSCYTDFHFGLGLVTPADGAVAVPPRRSRTHSGAVLVSVESVPVVVARHMCEG